MTMKIDGVDEMLAAMDELTSSEALKIQSFATRKAAIVVRDAVRDGAPIDDGVLRDSIHVEKLPLKKLIKNLIFQVGNTPAAWHGIFVEFGFQHKLGMTIPANHFFMNGIMKSKDKLSKVFADEYMKKLNRFLNARIKRRGK